MLRDERSGGLTIWAVEITNIAITVYLTTWFVDRALLSNTNKHITKSVKYMPSGWERGWGAGVSCLIGGVPMTDGGVPPY